MHRRALFLCSVLLTGCSAISTAHAADSERCRELNRKYELSKAQITAIEVSLTLFSSADGNCINLATGLLDQGASVDARDRLGARPLSHAARSGHLEMLDLLLARGAPIDARDLNGATALYYAAERGHGPIVQRLIERGADVKLTGKSGVSPVAAAAYAGRDSIVAMLLAHGADGDHAGDDARIREAAAAVSCMARGGARSPWVGAVPVAISRPAAVSRAGCGAHRQSLLFVAAQANGCAGGPAEVID